MLASGTSPKEKAGAAVGAKMQGPDTATASLECRVSFENSDGLLYGDNARIATWGCAISRAMVVAETPASSHASASGMPEHGSARGEHRSPWRLEIAWLLVMPTNAVNF